MSRTCFKTIFYKVRALCCATTQVYQKLPTLPPTSCSGRSCHYVYCKSWTVIYAFGAITNERSDKVARYKHLDRKWQESRYYVVFPLDPIIVKFIAVFFRCLN